MASPDYVLGGPVYWFMVTLLVLAGMLSAFVVLHALLVSRRGRLAGAPWSVAFYAVPQAVYLALLFIVQGPWLPLIAAAILVLITPLALIQQVVYLLRVVFPKRVTQAETVESGESEPHEPAAASAPEPPSETPPSAE